MNGNQRLTVRRLGRRTMTLKAAWFVLAAWLASAAGMLCPVANAQAVTGTVGVGSFSLAMQLNPVTNKVYVADFTSNSSPNNVIVIDGATNSTTTITTGVGTFAVGVNPVTNKIYAANINSNDVTVIDGATNTTATVAAGLNPSAVAVNPVTNKIYVANNGGNNVTVIDGATNTTTTVAAGSNPSAVAVNPATNKIYVANLNSANVTVIDGVTNSATTVSTGNDPVAVAVNPVTNKIYVANNLSANVTVIDGATNSTTTVSTGGNPDAVAVNPLTNKIYVANNQTANVTVIDGATNSTITVATGEIPGAVAVNPLTNKIYVGCGNNSNIVVINGATNTTTTIAGTQNQFTSLLVNPVTNKVYGNNSTSVTVIDAAAITTTLVTVGTNPQSIAANLETNKIYVPNRESNDVTVIDGATNATATVAAGAQPVAVAVNPATNKIYVANNSSANVTVVDGATNATATVAAGAQPVAVAANLLTNKIYVANNGSNNMTVIDGATNTTSTVPAGGQPVAVAVNLATNKIYVANNGSNNVTVIDGATNATTTVAAGLNPQAVAVNPVTNKIYVGNSGGNSLTVIDGATNSTTTIPTGIDSPIAVDVNPITNKIYFANVFNTVTVIDGATNAPTTITVGQQPVGIVVNPVTNKIYVANSGDITVTVIDGPTNTIIATIPSGLGPSGGMAVNPVTDTVYTNTAGGTGGKVLVLQEQQAPPIPLQAAITPLPGNITGIFTPTLHFSDSGAFPPLAPPVQAMYMQIDTWQGPWTLAASEGNEQFTATLATPLQPGIHIAYAYADLQDITSANQGTSSTPFVSNITGYAFVVAPPSTGLSPTSLDFGQQPVNTTSPAQTVTLTNANSPLDIGGISVSGHFLESDNCPAQLAAGASCTISVTFAPVSGDQGNTATGAVTITDDNHGITGNTDTIALTGVGSAPVTAPPTIAKAFGAASIPLNGSTSLTFSITNPNVNLSLTGVAFTDTLPAGLIVSTPNGLTGTCGGGTITAMAGSGSVSLTGATLGSSASCTFSLNVTGTSAGTKNNTTGNVTSANGGTGGTASASVTVLTPDVTITKTHAGNFTQGQTVGATYTITVSNIGTAPTVGAVSVTDALPAGLTATAIGGTGWTCPTLINCTRSDGLASGSSFPAITLTVSVAINAPASVINSVTVSGGGETDLTNDTAADTTAVTPLSGPPLTIVPLSNSANVSIPAGSPAAFGFTVTSSSALLGSINFTCSGRPSGAACSFDKQGETQPQTQVTMTITTTGRAKTSASVATNSGGTVPLHAALLLPFFGLVQLGLVQLRGRGRKSKSFRPRVAMLLGAFVLQLALVGCGGGRHGTPAGTYPISVTASSSTTPSAQATTVVNLTVQ